MVVFPTSLISIACSTVVTVAAFWIFFQAPLGRWKTSLRRTIRASRAEVWRLVDPLNQDSSWNPLWEQRDARQILDDPLTFEYLARPRGAKSEFSRRTESWTRVEPGVHLTSSVLKHGNVVIESSARSFEHLDLVEVDGGTRVILTAEGPVRGLFGHEMRRLALAEYLSALDGAARGRSGAKIPLIRFTGWRFVVLAFLSALIWFGWPTSEAASGGGALNAYFVPCLVTTTLFIAVVLHEVGHALALVAIGHRNVKISLIPFVGGVAIGPQKYENAFESGLVAIAGIAFSAAVCLFFLPSLDYTENFMKRLLLSQGEDRVAIVAALRYDPLPWIGVGAFAVTAFQLVVNLFSILPFPGSDGSMILKSFFSSRLLCWIAAASIYAIFAAMAGSLTTLVVIAGFYIVGEIANQRAKKSRQQLAVASTERQRLALAGILILTTACLGFEVSATHAFMTRTTPLLSHRADLGPEKIAVVRIDVTTVGDASEEQGKRNFHNPI